MDLTLIWKALLIGVVEGLTEFLPVSSTGHIILAEELLDFQGPPGKVFEIVIQLGAILAVCLLYRAKIWTTAMGVLERDKQATRFALAILVAFLPAAVIGVAAHKYIKSVLFSHLEEGDNEDPMMDDPTYPYPSLDGGGAAPWYAQPGYMQG